MPDEQHLKFYILDQDHHVIEEPDFDKWEDWFNNAANRRVVALTEINSEVQISTMFDGVYIETWRTGPPLVFETIIFCGKHDRESWRYSSWDDAVIGHEVAVRKARAALHAAHH